MTSTTLDGPLILTPGPVQLQHGRQVSWTLGASIPHNIFFIQQYGPLKKINRGGRTQDRIARKVYQFSWLCDKNAIRSHPPLAILRTQVSEKQDWDIVNLGWA